MYLEIAGHRVPVEQDAKRGLQTAYQEKPDICILATGMPNIDGFKLARRMRARAETAKSTLIALTGYGQEATGKRHWWQDFPSTLSTPWIFESWRRLLSSESFWTDS